MRSSSLLASGWLTSARGFLVATGSSASLGNDLRRLAAVATSVAVRCMPPIRLRMVSSITTDS
eukprot:4880669-Pyramimonas_sp.AAC.1